MKASSPAQRQRRKADANALLFFAETPYGPRPRLSRRSAARRRSRNRLNAPRSAATCGGVIESGLRSMKPNDAPPVEEWAPLSAGAGLERGGYLWLTAPTLGAVAIGGLARAFAGFP